MMANLYAALYRTYLGLKKSAAEGALRRWPGTGRGLDQLKRLIERRFLRKAQVWVRIQSGLSQGMWMHLRLPGEALIWRGEHDREVQNAILTAVRPGTVVYDIGAHVGTMALGAALLVGDLGLVVAFDGDPENIARLQEHSARNGLENRLRVVHTAVWSPWELITTISLAVPAHLADDLLQHANGLSITRFVKKVRGSSSLRSVSNEILKATPRTIMLSSRSR